MLLWCGEDGVVDVVDVADVGVGHGVGVDLYDIHYVTSAGVYDGVDVDACVIVVYKMSNVVGTLLLILMLLLSLWLSVCYAIGMCCVYVCVHGSCG